MSELSREQVEALAIALLKHGPAATTYLDMAKHLAPTVAAMLDERDRQARAEVVRDVEIAIENAANLRQTRHDVMVSVREVRIALARHASAAAGAPLTAQERASGPGQRDSDDKPAEGRTEPQCQSRPGHKVHFFRLGSTCQCGEVNAG